MITKKPSPHSKKLVKKQLWLSLLLALVVVVTGSSGAARAQDKTLFWERYDVALEVQQNSDMLVEEIQQIEFTSGTFHFGFAAIPLDRLDSITDVSVSEIISFLLRVFTIMHSFTNFSTVTMPHSVRAILADFTGIKLSA